MSDEIETAAAAVQHGPGRGAERPSDYSLRAWFTILKRVWAESNEDRVLLVAGGVTFYLLLALFPALAAFVSIYGFVADPRTVADHIAFLGGLLPAGGLELIEQQLRAITRQDADALTIGFYTGLAIALWSANNGIKALFEAMNIAYEETEKRGFLALNLRSGLFTLGAIVIAIAFLLTVGIVPAMLALINLDHMVDSLVRVLRWPVMLVVVAAGISVLYRYGPSREHAKWRWLTWGACIATVVWITTSIGFSYYLQNFADYNATYGSLGAVIGFMMWVWISVIVLILGAEINAEMEHQTARDTTTGPTEPMGSRGAVVADTVAKD